MGNFKYRSDGRSADKFRSDIENGEQLECKFCLGLQNLSDRLKTQFSIQSISMTNAPGTGIDHGNKKNDLDAYFVILKDNFPYVSFSSEIKINPCHFHYKWKKDNIAEKRTIFKIDSLSACIKKKSPIIWVRKDYDDICWLSILTVDRIKNLVEDTDNIKPYSHWSPRTKSNKPCICAFHDNYSWHRLNECSSEIFNAFIEELCNSAFYKGV